MKQVFASAFVLVLILMTYSLAQTPDSLSHPLASCRPDSLLTIYDKQAADTIPDAMQIRMWYSFGSEYIKHEEYASALPYLWRVFIYDTTRLGMLSIRKIADAYFQLKEADSTLLACYRGLERYPDVDNLHYYAGFLQVNHGRFSCAIPHFEALVQRNPENEAFLERLASLYFRENDQRAIEVQKRLVKLSPRNVEYQNRLVAYLESFGHDPLDELRIAFQKDTSSVETALRLGKAEYAVGNYEQALLAFNRAIQIDPQNVNTYRLRAHCYEGLRKHTLAIADYERILRERSGDADIMCAIATQYKLLDHFADAAHWAQRAIAIKPAYGLPYIVMAEIYEAAVSYCQNQSKRKRKIDDGLVYGKAIEQYRLALQDPAYAGYAQRRIELLEPYLPTKEEIFFNPDQKIKDKCYTSWIKDE